MLVFGCTSGRSGPEFLGTMIQKATAQLLLYGWSTGPQELFDHVIFCAISTRLNGKYKKGVYSPKILPAFPPPIDVLADAGLWLDLTVDPTLQDDHGQPLELATAWSALLPGFPTDRIHTLPSIDHALDLIRGIGSQEVGQVRVLVTGSIYIVGGVMKLAGLTDIEPIKHHRLQV